MPPPLLISLPPPRRFHAADAAAAVDCRHCRRFVFFAPDDTPPFAAAFRQLFSRFIFAFAIITPSAIELLAFSPPQAAADAGLLLRCC
jgi:hypothetical protein